MAHERALLQIQKVTAGYVAGQATLHDVSLEVMPGEISAVVSLDGGGKTTLLRCAAGLLRPQAGTVRFDGEDVYGFGFRDDQRFRSRCAVVLEGGALLDNQSVWDNVALPLRYHGGVERGALKSTVERLLAVCGFNEDPLSLPWQVSGRGQRLAAFARALARDPALVIVDRFFEGLEMPDWRRLFELVMEMNQNRGMSWLLISELDASIFQVAERVAVLDEGRLLDYGHRARLYRNVRIRGAFEAANAQPVMPQMAATAMAGDQHLDLLAQTGLALDSSAPLGSGTGSDMEPTISLSGIMPTPTKVDPPKKRAAGQEPAPTPPGLGSTTGFNLHDSVDAEGELTVFVGSSDLHAPLPAKPPARGKRPPTAMSLAETLLPVDNGLAPTPPPTSPSPDELPDDSRDDGPTDEGGRPALDDTDASQVIDEGAQSEESDPSARAAKKARQARQARQRKPSAKTIEMQAPAENAEPETSKATDEESAPKAGTGRAKRPAPKSKPNARTVEMPAPAETGEPGTSKAADEKSAPKAGTGRAKRPAPKSKPNARTVEMPAPAETGEPGTSKAADEERAPKAGTGRAKRPAPKSKPNARTVEMPAPAEIEAPLAPTVRLEAPKKSLGLSASAKRPSASGPAKRPTKRPSASGPAKRPTKRPSASGPAKRPTKRPSASGPAKRPPGASGPAKRPTQSGAGKSGPAKRPTKRPPGASGPAKRPTQSGAGGSGPAKRPGDVQRPRPKGKPPKLQDPSQAGESEKEQ